jgi:hypothetical protein
MPRTRTYGLDVDTIAYAARVKAGSGVTILPENLKQINKFVIGVKKLGLWNSMVCWPMRSIHNAGRGSTVYSLGGLHTANGTLVNAPTWGVRGITVNTGQIITLTPSIICPQLISTGFVVQPLTTSSGYYITSDQDVKGLFLNHHWASQGRYFSNVPTGLDTSYGLGRYSIQNNFFTDLSLKFITFQRNIADTHPSIFTNGVLRDGGVGGSDFTLAVNRAMTNVRCIKDSLYSTVIIGSNFDMEIIRPLYKRTLGIDLNLPY